MPTLIELGERVEAKAKENEQWMRTFTNEKGQYTFNEPGSPTIAEFHGRMEEFKALADEFQTATAADNAAKKALEQYQQLQQVQSSGVPFPLTPGASTATPAGFPGAPTMTGAGPVVARKSLGEQFVESASYRGRSDVEFPEVKVRLDAASLYDAPPVGVKSFAGLPGAASAIKTTVDEASAYAPFSPRMPLVVPYANRRLVIADLIPQQETEFPAILYMAQTGQTINAAAVSEAGTKPESAFAWTQETALVQFIAHFIPVTRQVLDDIVGIRDIIDQQMTYGLMIAEETELLSGSGTTPHIQGVLTVSGLQTQALGADPIPTGVMKLFTKIRGITPGTGFAEPSGVIMHPTDYTTLVTYQTSTGAYLFGDPSTSDGIQRIWGKPIVHTPAMTLGTLLTGDFATYDRIYRRLGVTIEVSNSHASYFINNLYAIRAEERLTRTITRGSAFGTLTGL